MYFPKRYVERIVRSAQENDHQGSASASVAIVQSGIVYDNFSYTPGQDDYTHQWLERISEAAGKTRTLLMSVEPSVNDINDARQQHPMVEVIKGFKDVHYFIAHQLPFRRGKSVDLPNCTHYQNLDAQHIDTLVNAYWSGGNPLSEQDSEYMIQAIEQAQHSQANAKPYVGAVLVGPGGILAQATQEKRNQSRGKGKIGVRHAEHTLLNQAIQDDIYLADKSIYVTLEPCMRLCSGQENSCCEHIVHDNIARVVIGLLDSRPSLNGRGVEYLRSNQIEATVLPTRSKLNGDLLRLKGTRVHKQREQRDNGIEPKPDHKSWKRRRHRKNHYR